MISSVPVARVSSRSRVVEARVGQDDADVGQRGLGEHAGDVALGERGFQRGGVVELDDARGDRGVDRRPDVALARRRPSRRRAA